MAGLRTVVRDRVELVTPEGRMPCHLFDGSGDGGVPVPAVVYLMDGMGIRPTLLESAARLAAEGCFVVVPDLYYRGGDYPPFDHATLQDDPQEQKRIMQLVALVTNDGVMDDLRAIFAELERRPRVRPGPLGCVGYCMGGPLALYAAGTFPERVAVAASIHGANLATDRPDSPHFLAPRMRGELYLAVAEHDPYILPDETERIDAALREAGASYTLERYAGCHHGFALVGAHGYDAAADERHRAQLLAMLRRHCGLGEGRAAPSSS